MTSIIQKSKDSILYQLPQGKPDPRVPCSLATIHARPLVPQQPQKGSTCWYYAMNMIRDRIGKMPSEELESQRHIELACSERRKAYAVQRDLQFQQISLAKALKEDPHFSPFNATTIPGAKLLLLKLQVMLPGATGEAKVKIQELISILNPFQSQTAVVDLIDYLNDYHFRELSKINLSMLEKMGVDPEVFYKEEDFDAINTSKYSSFALYLKKKPCEAMPLLDSYAFRTAYKAYGLVVSRFHPTQGAQSLYQALERDGPMYCKGKFGKAYYLVEPVVVEQIASKNIWGWRKSDPKKEQSSTHSVVVIGARISSGASGGFVYFVDPLDGSHPDNPEQQKVYVMAYNGFISKLADLKHKMQLNEEGIQVAFSYGTGYGLHPPRFNAI